MSNGDTCTQILCRAQDYPDDGSLTIALNATGAGGIALNSNFNKLQYRQPKCNYTPGLGDPSNGIGGGQIYCVGSRWLNTGAGSVSSLAMWICVDNSAQDNAVWTPWAFWVDPTAWSGGNAPAGPLGASVAQRQSLAYANAHFSIEGEYRSIYFGDEDAGSPVVLVPQQTGMSNGAVILGKHGQAPGGDSRGPSAVDFQNSRAVDAQVASGSNSFIAGGKNNTAAGDTSHAQGEFSQATGASSHAEGACDSKSTKLASGQGAHVQGDVANSGTVTASGHTNGVRSRKQILSLSNGSRPPFSLLPMSICPAIAAEKHENRIKHTCWRRPLDGD